MATEQATKSELYRKYRPTTLEGLVGQSGIVQQFQGFIKNNTLPHCMIFSGPSGTGKTTLCRILRQHLGCLSDTDFHEINAANQNGVDDIREIEQDMKLKPMLGDAKMWHFGEAHMLTTAAQNCMLTITEDCPDHVRFILSTTEKQKIIPTLRSRFKVFEFKSIPATTLVQLLNRVAIAEKMVIKATIIAEIAEAAQGSARNALQFLQQVQQFNSPEEQLLAINRPPEELSNGYDLAVALWKGEKWGTFSPKLKDIKTEEIETVRQTILIYATSILLKGGPPRAAELIELFQYNFFDSKKAGLSLACFKFLCGQRRP